MTLFNALRALPEFVVVGLNFSSATSPELIMDTFHQHCEYQNTPSGIVLHPKQLNKWLVVFCDEINLPAADTYETVQVITFTRQLVEHGGFWRSQDNKFVKLERIQFV
jgi:dynein heavy chain 1